MERKKKNMENLFLSLPICPYMHDYTHTLTHWQGIEDQGKDMP